MSSRIAIVCSSRTTTLLNTRKKGNNPSLCVRFRARRWRSCSTSTSRSEEHTSELQSQFHLVCLLLLEKKNRRRLAGEVVWRAAGGSRGVAGLESFRGRAGEDHAQHGDDVSVILAALCQGSARLVLGVA